MSVPSTSYQLKSGKRIRWLLVWLFLVFLILLLPFAQQLVHTGSDDQDIAAQSNNDWEGAPELLAEQEQLSVLDQLLQKQWPEVDQLLRPSQEPPMTREEFVKAAATTHDARAVLLQRNYAAPLDEHERYIVLSNNRFFSIDTRNDPAYATRDLYLYYENLDVDIEKPVIRLMPHFAGRSRTSGMSHQPVRADSNKISSFEIQDNALIFPIDALGDEWDAWTIHVDPVNALGFEARRYLVFFK